MCMRAIFVGMVLACIAAPPSRADDENEKKRIERLEKKLAELEAGLEKSDEAIKGKELIVELTKILESADRIDLLRLKPQRTPREEKDPETGFHDYEIRGESRVDDEKDRRKIAEFLGNTFHWDKLRVALCFNPGYGVRAKLGKETWDFLICFHCNQVQVYRDRKFYSSLPLAFVKGSNLLDQMLPMPKEK
jgi:hypothetical protein